MIIRIAWFEYRYMTRSISTLVLAALLLGLSFLLTANSSEFLDKGGNVYINSPYMITLSLMILGIFSSLITPSFMADAILKDQEHRFAGVLYATPVGESVYLSGRFLGAFLALMTALAAAPLGMILGQLWPWADRASLAPLNLAHYGIAFFGFLLPSMLVVACFIFSVAVITRRSLYTYLAAFAMLVLYMVVSETNAIGPLWDPFMHRILEEYTRYWTAAERNTRMLQYDARGARSLNILHPSYSV